MKKLYPLCTLALLVALAGYGQNSDAPTQPASPVGLWQPPTELHSVGPDYRLPSHANNSAPKSTFGVQDVQSKLTGWDGNVYDETEYSFSVESAALQWDESRYQADPDEVLMLRMGATYPFTPLNSPGYWTTNFILCDTMNGTSFDGNTYVLFKSWIEFDDNGHPAGVINLRKPSSEWINIFKALYQFDVNGNNTGATTFDPSGENDWVPVMDWSYTYDDQDNLMDFNVSAWNAEADEWQDFSQFEFEYDNDLLMNVTRTEIIGDEWLNSTRWENTYDQNGGITSETTLMWQDGEWINDYKITFEYDASNNLVTRAEYVWVEADWMEVTVSGFVYDEDNVLTAATLDTWNANSGNVQKFMIFHYAHNDFGQITHVYSESWNGSEYAPVAFADAEVFLHYTEFETGTEDQTSEIADIRLYPNPATDQLRVKWNNAEINHIRIMDITGRVVYETKGNFGAAEATVSVSHIPDGLYLIQVGSGAKTGTKTFVVSR